MLIQLMNTVAVASFVLWIYMSTWFLIAWLAKRNDVADIAWGLGFVVCAVAGLMTTPNKSPTALLVVAMVFVWGLRLSWHIGSRNIKKAEDYRYKAWREAWGKWFLVRSYLQIFMFQGLLILLIVSPILLITAAAPSGMTALALFGAIFWLFGFGFETIGDKQLRAFVNNPQNKGRIMNKGLWRYTRHPNYFGELSQWWSIGIIALSVSYGWLGLVGPTVITLLIVKISGIPLLEKKYVNNPQYQAYKLQTSSLIPLPPRKLAR